jgi:2,3-dihydro-2,3-dihydroxybenzoate dehydrogenase
MNFHGKTAIITGAAQGIGAAVAQALAQAGAKLALIDIQADTLEATTQQLRQYGTPVQAYPLDIGNSQHVDEAIERIQHQFGNIHHLVNVAGILRMGAITELSNTDWERTITVNLNGVFFVSRRVAKTMISQGTGGSMVTVSSNAASVPRIGMAAYAASKAASTHFTKCLGLELAPHGIRCNIVSPGSTDTDMQRHMSPSLESQQRILLGSLEHHRLGIPLQRLATPEDISNAVCFLLSDQARHITMHDMRVDGGATLGG